MSPRDSGSSLINKSTLYADLARLLKQALVEATFRDVRLAGGGGGVGASKELLSTLMKMCGTSRALEVDLDHGTGIANFLGSLSDTQGQIPAMYAGNEGRQFLDSHLIPSLEVFEICRYWVRFLQQLVLVNRIDFNSIIRNGQPSDQRGLYHFFIYREEEHENIDENFAKDYGATQINLIESLAIGMMGHLPQLDEMCILPNRQHFYRGK
ncbi:hypothetical protein FBULB1_3036 [Fusarium bulbicola]|nr:hypothetical protein FBULB1_3036 [Fusarium bulbicola]